MTAGDSQSPVVVFTDQDARSVIQDLVTFAQATFPGEHWTNFNESDGLYQLLELNGYSTDLIAYQLNACLNETVLMRCVRGQNLSALMEPFGVEWPSAIGSSVAVTLTLDPNGPYPFTITPRIQVQSVSGVVFQPLSPATIAAPQPGNTFTMTFTAGTEHYLEFLSSGTGLANQSATLLSTDVQESTLVVSVDSIVYTRVPNFVASLPTDQVYTLGVDDSGVATVTFGDGVRGVMPQTGVDIRATYRDGGGTASNVPPGTITVQGGSSDGSTFPPQILSFTNATAATNGADRPTLAEVRRLFIATQLTQDRITSLPDYTAAALKVNGIQYAYAIDGPPQSGVRPVYLFVVPSGGGTLGAALRATVQNSFGLKKGGRKVRLLDASQVQIQVELDAYLQDAAVKATVDNLIRNRLQQEYDLGGTQVDFGVTLTLQGAYNAISPSTIPGLSRSLFRTFTVIPYSSRYVLTPTTGDGDVNYFTYDATTATSRIEWSITVHAPSIATNYATSFTVTRTLLGTVTLVTDTVLSDDSATFTFDGLVGLTLAPAEADGAVSASGSQFTILGNTRQDVTVASGLLTTFDVGDLYVVEAPEPAVGKVLLVTSTQAVTASTALGVSSVAGFQVNDTVVVVPASGAAVVRTVVTAIDTVNNILAFADPITVAIGDAVASRWVSQDGTLQFSLLPGDTPFADGDELFVETFPQVNDLVLRDGTFPRFSDTNVVVNLIGGSS